MCGQSGDIDVTGKGSWKEWVLQKSKSVKLHLQNMQQETDFIQVTTHSAFHEQDK